ncbi:hypothetical protein ABDK00_008955 [Niabella insulamsoli]|uniref:hypothetical protein n=1 Tax=Niabella insulamsoli TaxID=3144874 RepID=UPI0031FCAA05
MTFLRTPLLILVLFSAINSLAQTSADISFGSYLLRLSDKGVMKFLGRKMGGKSDNFLSADVASYLMSIKRFGEDDERYPDKVITKKVGNSYALKINFGKDIVEVLIKVKKGYLTAEAVRVVGEKNIELINWGKIHTRFKEHVGQSAGVVYDDQAAVGFMGLNVKSSGGFEINHRERFGNAAQRTAYGSVLQGFTRNRAKQRLDDNFFQERTVAVPVKDDDALLTGSKFAIFCAERSGLLPLISIIEIEEGLPHLKHNNEWIKTSSYATSSKFIMSYDIHNIDACLDIAQRAGITNVYHPNIFKTWGTYLLDKEKFPEGAASVALCSEKARQRNMNLGAHTLSNFITTNDPLVTPVPSEQLQLAAPTDLSKSLSIEDDTIFLKKGFLQAYAKDAEIKTEKVYNVNRNRELFAVKIGKEIIEYSEANLVGDAIRLTGCKRGAFQTVATAHSKGSQVARLVSHSYKVFFADINLQDEVAQHLAAFFNEAQLKRISFDGVEGGVATGHNRYGGERFIDVFFKHLKDKNIVANSSDVMHYAWHYLSNESWGEPWWSKSFRESQLDHRLRVQAALKDDLLPRKMGQFSIRDSTTLKDIQWIMGLCAGYETGVDFYISPQIIKKNPEGEQILKAIKDWEAVRLKGSLSNKQKELLRNVYNLYSLEGTLEHPRIQLIESWEPEQGKLQNEHERNTLPEHILESTGATVISLDYRHQNYAREPGQPTHSVFDFYSSGPTQPLKFAIRVSPNATHNVAGIYLRSGARELRIPFELKPGELVVFDDDQVLKHYTASKELLETARPSKAFQINNGHNEIIVDYNPIAGAAGPELIFNFKIDKNKKGQN